MARSRHFAALHYFGRDWHLAAYQTQVPNGRYWTNTQLRDLDSCCATLCGDDRIGNVNQIKHLDGHHQPAVAPQMGRG